MAAWGRRIKNVLKTSKQHTYQKTVYRYIQFRMEIEKNEQLPFLDVLFKKQINEIFGIGVYREIKRTRTDTYISTQAIALR